MHRSKLCNSWLLAVLPKFEETLLPAACPEILAQAAILQDSTICSAVHLSYHDLQTSNALAGPCLADGSQPTDTSIDMQWLLLFICTSFALKYSRHGMLYDLHPHNDSSR